MSTPQWNSKSTMRPPIDLKNKHRTIRTHGSDDGAKTACGNIIRDTWVIEQVEDYSGLVTCHCCIRILKRKYHRKLKEDFKNGS